MNSRKGWTPDDPFLNLTLIFQTGPGFCFFSVCLMMDHFQALERQGSSGSLNKDVISASWIKLSLLFNLHWWHKDSIQREGARLCDWAANCTASELRHRIGIENSSIHSNLEWAAANPLTETHVSGGISPNQVHATQIPNDFETMVPLPDQKEPVCWIDVLFFFCSPTSLRPVKKPLVERHLRMQTPHLVPASSVRLPSLRCKARPAA